MFEDDNLPLMVSEWQDNGTLLDYMPIIPRGPKTLFMVSEVTFKLHLVLIEPGSRNCFRAFILAFKGYRTCGFEKRTFSS